MFNAWDSYRARKLRWPAYRRGFGLSLTIGPRSSQPPSGRGFRCSCSPPSCASGGTPVCRLLRIAGTLAEGHWSSFHRVLSARRWSPGRLARRLAQQVLKQLVSCGVVSLSGDDTVTSHPGKKVYGEGEASRRGAFDALFHRVEVEGHKWVVLAIQVRLPGCDRPWALPVLCALYCSTPRRTLGWGVVTRRPCDLMRHNCYALLLRWFPQRKFRFSGDGGYGTHALAPVRRAAAAVEPGEQVLSGRQPVRSAAETTSWDQGTPASDGKETPRAAGGRGEDTAGGSG